MIMDSVLTAGRNVMENVTVPTPRTNWDVVSSLLTFLSINKVANVFTESGGY